MNGFTRLRQVWHDYFAQLKKAEERRLHQSGRDAYDSRWTDEQAVIDQMSYDVIGADGLEGFKDLSIAEAAQLLDVPELLKKSQVIVFNAGQAQVFADLDMSPLGYEHYGLPFDHIFLRFPGGIACTDFEIQAINKYGDQPHLDSDFRIEAILVSRHEFEGRVYEAVMAFEAPTLGFVESQRDKVKRWGEYGLPIEPLMPGGYWAEVYTQNEIVHSFDQRVRLTDFGPNISDANLEFHEANIRKLVNACIGYINCENIYLHREEVPEKVNRKREAKGKSKLEPYYICRIRGVNYDSHTTGTGTEHGHRYDVRGHFRRLETGKVTWVRPHQRGLKHELYIPKTYLVDRRPSA